MAAIRSMWQRWQALRHVDRTSMPGVQLLALACPVEVPAIGCEHHPHCSRQRPTACAELISRPRYVLFGACSKHRKH